VNTQVLEETYEIIRFESEPTRGMCTLCYELSDILYPPGEYLDLYIRQAGYTGEIYLCDTCMKDLGGWGAE